MWGGGVCLCVWGMWVGIVSVLVFGLCFGFRVHIFSLFMLGDWVLSWMFKGVGWWWWWCMCECVLGGDFK